MSLRNYNKLYVHKDREEGSQKILLGYENNDKEILLKKNTETIFNVPHYTTTLKLADSTLIQDGATAGPFPAASDRIYKNRKDYGKTTPNGITSDISDGLWFCSWLYKDPAGKVQWMDRYYNPGSFVFDIAEIQLGETIYRKFDSRLRDGSTYIKNDPVYRDVPSTMLLEQGVQYRYFHIGEESAQEMLTTFRGISGTRLKMNLNGWGTEQVDTSLYKQKTTIITDGSYQEIYDNAAESDRLDANTINFNNSRKTIAYVDYDPSYGNLNEFTLSFWAQSNYWNQSQATQLVGNFSTKGGVGVFVDTLSSYPYFVIPETGYGHLLYVNENYDQFLDRSLHPAVSLTATPLFAAFDSDHNVIIGNSDTSKKIRKLDHTGKVLAEANVPVSPTETPLQLLCGRDDSIVFITNKARYTFNKNFVLENTTSWESLSTTVAAFAYDIETDQAELLSMDNVLDCKFIGTDRWCLSATNGNLYTKPKDSQEDVLFAEFNGEKGSVFGIDPYQRIWVMHGNNGVSVYDSKAEPNSDPLFQFKIGSNNYYERKNISFFCEYNRETQTRQWRAIIYYGDSSRNLENPEIYILNMKGSIVKVVNILSLFDFYTLTILKQEQSRMEFFGRGDFTGYERHRVFDNLSPYNNQPQIILKASLKDTSKDVLPYTVFKNYYSIGNWNSRSWQHFALTLKNRSFILYNNGVPVINIPYSGSYEMTYESQPALFIGSPVGVQYGFNQEIGKTTSIFNGKIQNVEVYDYALEQKNLEMFQRAVIPAQDIYWSLPTPTIQYMETIERMFKNKIPGAKSSFFNIKLCGTTIQDKTTRMLIEDAVRDIVEQIKPAYATFLEVKWVD